MLWKEVVATLPEAIAGHLRNASRVAISGPNGLEILFPVRYSFSRSYCQRPETVSKLQSAVQQVAGRPLTCAIGNDGAAVEPAPEAQTPKPKRGASLDSMRRNAFVQQVSSIFGGTVVDVKPVTGTGQNEA
ncbi:MAG: hypothetical protein U0992_11560 [Planctomycetaceae bacterium]